MQSLSSAQTLARDARYSYCTICSFPALRLNIESEAQRCQDLVLHDLVGLFTTAFHSDSADNGVQRSHQYRLLAGALEVVCSLWRPSCDLVQAVALCNLC